MGAESSLMKQPTRRETERRAQRSMPTSQYYDLKNTKYIESDSQSMSSESTTTSEDGDEKKEPRLFDKTQKDPKKSNVSTPLKAFEGLTPVEKVKKSEEMLRRLWRRPHPSWDIVTAVTSITNEKTNTDGQLTDEAFRDIDYNVDKIIYDIPLDYCHLKVPRTRTSRSCPDPWRRHGAHVKLCEIGGFMPESKNKNARVTPIRKGSTPPPPPRSKPLQNIDDYLKLVKKY
ncbi:hypothetical protein CAEBREN_31172 [Caenorhabditis brenneri]|uniref:Uncharacterized protein n=1 Tax=Caenorhabditis brenneri TaxID=135651 RepID=G0NJK8_CAEBE|nr:hypothetical protein CAEBREN_31172 [Caenorhabditis brenneri]